MSKRKILSITVLAAFTLYLISGGFIFGMAKEIQSRDFTKISREFDNELYARVKNAKTREDLINTIHYQPSKSSRYPFVFAVFDWNGRVIVSSEPVIVIENHNYDTDSCEYITAEVEPFLTDKIKAELIDAARYSVTSPLTLKSVSLIKDGEKYIPTEITIYCSLDENGPGTVKFSRRQPDVTFDETAGRTMFLYGIGVHDDRVFTEYQHKLNGYIDDFSRNFKKTHSEFIEGGSAFDGSDICQSEVRFVLDGEQYCYYFDSRYDIGYDALTSDAFFYALTEISILFAVITAVLLIVVSKIYDKNRKMNESRDAFISAAAHELKTPVAVIANKCECILESVSPELDRVYVGDIYGESKRMSRMIQTLLQYNKISSGDRPEMKEFSLMQTTIKCVEKYRSYAEGKGITLTADTTDDIIIKGDCALIGAAIDNYLSNAVKFTPENGRITVTLSGENKKFRLEVYNSGSRIEEKDGAHIWEEMYCGDKSRTDGTSTGMGLAICRLVFRLHGYDYGYRNEKDGVTFRFGN